MVASQLRANARESLTGKWGKAALLTLSYSIIFFVITFVGNLIPLIGTIAVLIVSTPITYGLLVSFMKLKRGEEVGYVDFLSNGFSSFGKVWGVLGNTILKMILPICLVIISVILLVVGTTGTIFGTASSLVSRTASVSMISGFGFLTIIGFIAYIVSLIYIVIKGFSYSLSFYILNDNPEMTGKEIVNESERLMKGNKWRYLWLTLTFIGWAFLSAFTFGIGMLWLMPYITISMICFYEDLAGKNTTTVVETETKTE